MAPPAGPTFTNPLGEREGEADEDPGCAGWIIGPLSAPSAALSSEADQTHP